MQNRTRDFNFLIFTLILPELLPDTNVVLLLCYRLGAKQNQVFSLSKFCINFTLIKKLQQ